MGCGTSSTTAVDGDAAPNGKVAPGVRPPPTGADDEDIPTEVLPESAPGPIKPPLAFEISLDKEDEAESTQGLVKKHPPRPPKRLQRLNSIEPSAPSLNELQEKMESAEKRRLTILQSRIASANKTSRQIMKMAHKENDENVQMDDILDSPTKGITELKNQINAEEHGVVT